MNDSTFEVWHKLDSEFLEPRASLKIRIFSPKEVTSIDEYVHLTADYSKLSFFLTA